MLVRSYCKEKACGAILLTGAPLRCSMICAMSGVHHDFTGIGNMAASELLPLDAAASACLPAKMNHT